jgi:hypothetical protein
MHNGLYGTEIELPGTVTYHVAKLALFFGNVIHQDDSFYGYLELSIVHYLKKLT